MAATAYPELVHDLLGHEGLKIIQREDLFRLSLDAALLAAFVRINPRTRAIIDLGSGLGPLPLLLSCKTKAKITGIEINPDLCDLARKSVALNQLTEQIAIIQDDIRVVHSRFAPASFDIVVTNPPFFRLHDGFRRQAASAVIAARHETSIDFPTIAQQAKRLLKLGGLFVFIQRAGRLEELVQHLEKTAFAIKRIRYVHAKPDRPALLMLVEAAAGGKRSGLRIEPPLFVHKPSGEYTEEALNIFNDKAGEYLETTSEL